MKKLFFIWLHELRCLGRDRAGLLTLFLMPAVLVVLITLVQENVMELTGQARTRVAWLNLEGDGPSADLVKEKLAAANLLLIEPHGSLNREKRLAEAVRQGEFQAGIVVGREPATGPARGDSGGTGNNGTGSADVRIPQIRLYFDPGIMASLRSAVTAQVRMAVQTVVLEQRLHRLRQELMPVLEQMGMNLQWPESGERDNAVLAGCVQIMDDDGSGSGRALYNPVQQNVAAWALFGVFFSAVPLAGSILWERSSGIWIRLQSLPVSPLQLTAGKMAAYVCVCLLQFMLITLIGIFFFPRIGLPAFSLGAPLAELLLVALCASLAACGLGMALGALCSSFEQASAIGATVVVASAAVGGIMVPVYAMPRIMQQISVVSPLNWALDAFEKLLVRQAGLREILPDLGLLVLFFLLALLLARGRAAGK